MCRGDPAYMKTKQGLPISTMSLDAVYEFNPFLYDYFYAERMNGTIDFMHLSCSPGIAMLDKLRLKNMSATSLPMTCSYP